MAQDQQPQWVKDLALFTLILVDVTGYTGAGLGLGYLAWTKLGFPWVTMLVLALIGLAMAMYRIYRFAKIQKKK